MKSKVDLTQGPVSRAIVTMTLPMMVGMVGMVAFNLVDTYFIGQLGTDALAAMSFTLPVVMMQGAISMGLGVGASAVISRAIGEGDAEKVKRLTTDALLLSVGIVIFFVIAGLLTIDPLFRLLGAGPTLLGLIRRYMRIWYLGVAFVVVPMVGNNAIRAAGNTVIPSAVMLTAIVMNVLLDPLLIFGLGPFPRLELEGAALATVFARSVTFVVSLLFLHYKFGMLSFRLAGWSRTLDSWRQVVFVGVPAALTYVLIPLSMGFVTRLIASQGTAAVAAFGVGTRIEMFLLSPIVALGAVITPFTGQNIGAGRLDRVRDGFFFGTRFSLGLGALLWGACLLGGARAGSLFNADPAVFEAVGRYLRIVGLGYGCHGVSMIAASVFNAMNRPFSAMAVNFVKLVVLLIPLAYLGREFAQLDGIFTGVATAFLVSGVGAFFWVHRATRP